MLLTTALNEFMLAKAADGLSVATIKWYRSELSSFVRGFHNVEIVNMTTNELRGYIVTVREKDQRYVDASQRPVVAGGYSSASIAAHVRALHAFWAWCAAEYHIDNPMRNIKRPKQQKPIPKAAAIADFVKLFNVTGNNPAGVRDRAILAFFADTGCRLGGLLSVTLSDLDLVNLRAVVIEKGEEQRVVYFTRITGQLIRIYLDVRFGGSEALFLSVRGDALTSSGVAQILKRLKHRANVRGRVNPHAFRHNFARSYIQNGGDISTLARMLGHANISTTAAYYAVFTENELADMHRKFSPLANMDLNLLFEN